MASVFESAFGNAMGALGRALGETATLTHVDDQSTETVTVIFNEFVGAIDDRRRAIFTLAGGDVATTIQRGDYFVLSGETTRWTVTDVRDDKSGGLEIRCDGTLERL